MTVSRTATDGAKAQRASRKEADNAAIELDPLRREAVDWVHRLASGRATVADAEALKCWRGRSPAHEAAYADARRLWQAFGPAARNCGAPPACGAQR